MPVLPARYDPAASEPRRQQRWAELAIYEFDPTRSDPVYTVDTPPPTVSGAIHVGHVYSYTHADVMSRYQRMQGRQVLYPFGFDDNGLPTERFTENSKGIRARDVGRQAFIEACLELSKETEEKFERFWKRLGLSVDWRLRYSTIDPRSRRVSQAAFLDLFHKQQVYRADAPTLWCPECQTAVAQADVDDLPGVASQFTTLAFALDDGTVLPIATTRPELLAACVAVMVHPEDVRYAHLASQFVTTPLFNLRVPVIADPKVDREKGTGAVMCCTFGDVADVAWWRAYHLPLRIVLTRDGRLNELAGQYASMRIKQARTAILKDLADAGKVIAQQAIEHTVSVHERCGTPIEYLVALQWFIKLLEHKERYLEAGRQIAWHPEHMRGRYESWIRGLNWDWNISRQRYYGVPFPVWYCTKCSTTIVADPSQLPVDPQVDRPLGGACPHCGSTELVAETDVLDTWATSSTSPQICGTLLEPYGVTPAQFDERYRPMTLRPNAHDIIRTWDFYTIVRSMAIRNEIPWTDVLISGHALDPAGKKISKSKRTVAEDPTDMVEKFSADAVRYWATSVRTGGDTVLSDEVMRNGNRLVTKLWNATRLVLPHLEGFMPDPDWRPTIATDRWLLHQLAGTIRQATNAFNAYEFAAAKAETERFFWTDFCDNYLELVKYRLYSDVATVSESARTSARATLAHVIVAVLKLLAPVMPHVTDDLFTAIGEVSPALVAGSVSVHTARWPVAEPSWLDPTAEPAGRAILEVLEAVRRWKSEHKLSMGVTIASCDIACSTELVAALTSASIDLTSATRAGALHIHGASPGAPLEVRITPQSEFVATALGES